MSSGLFKNVINKMCSEIIYFIYMYKNLALNNLKWLICHKTKPNPSIFFSLLLSIPSNPFRRHQSWNLLSYSRFGFSFAALLYWFACHSSTKELFTFSPYMLTKLYQVIVSFREKRCQHFCFSLKTDSLKKAE